MILGISCFYHDSAAAIIDDKGTILAAVQEERFTRVRHTPAFPVNAVKWCLKRAGCRDLDLECIGFYESPILKFERILDTFLSTPRGNFKTFIDVIPSWFDTKVYQTQRIVNELLKIAPDCDPSKRLYCVPHHASHAASAFYPCPWPNALVITVDGVGEYATTAVAVGDGNKLELQKEVHFPHSLGLLFSAFTYFCGFKVNSGEYKLMGLAPYGEPKYADVIRAHILTLNQDGSFRVNAKYFDGFAEDLMVAPLLDDLFDGPPLPQGHSPTQREADIARSVQQVLEEAMLNLVRSQIAETGIDRVCLAGGVALNCVVNGRLLRELPIRGLWMQPAAGDAGGALGAALFLHHMTLKRPRIAHTRTDGMKGAFLGPSYTDEEIKNELDSLGAVYSRLDERSIVDKCARLLGDGKTLAWFQGAMEYGPRALGSRSILADPRLPNIQRDLNLKIKKRESFRPFAPAVLRERVSEWFELSVDSPYMLLTASLLDVRRKQGSTARTDGALQFRQNHSQIPAVTHVDYSARVQTVDADTSPRFHKLLGRFAQLTGCPILLNTSFNVRGEPIVCTPTDAFRCFMNTELDYLAIGDLLLAREKQDTLAELRCAQTFDPD